MYRNNACPTIENCNNKVQVKTERDIEQQLGIKVEPIPTTQAATMVTPNAKNLYQGSPSKPLIDKLLDLQKENQRYVLELKKKDIEHAEVLLKKQQTEGQLNEKLRTLSAELDELQSELSNAKTKLTEQEAKNTQTISDLNRKNQMLDARLKQLENGIRQQKTYNETNDSVKSDENVFEVEKLIGHKKKNGCMLFLVRWQNFSPEHDSWERESNLMCPDILKEYKRTMNAFSR